MSALRQLARAARAIGEVPEPEERCDLCGAAVSDPHDHVVDLESRRLCCTCRACAILFQRSDAPTPRYQTVADRVLVADAPVSLSAWTALQIPVALSFVFYNSRIDGWVAIYPSAAGAVESSIEPGAIAELGATTPLIDLLRPDVEAVLARGRRGAAAIDLMLVPISAGYELVGRIRRHWRGFDGGDVARREIESFIAQLQARARTVTARPGGCR